MNLQMRTVQTIVNFIVSRALNNRLCEVMLRKINLQYSRLLNITILGCLVTVMYLVYTRI
jgi:hypothetical protein